LGLKAQAKTITCEQFTQFMMFHEARWQIYLKLAGVNFIFSTGLPSLGSVTPETLSCYMAGTDFPIDLLLEI